MKESANSYILLNEDKSDNPKLLESEYIKDCLSADLVYVCNKDGYIGTTIAFELGILSNNGQEIYFMENPRMIFFCDIIFLTDLIIIIE